MPTGVGHRAKPPPGSVADWKVSYQWSGIRARIPHRTTASTGEATPGDPLAVHEEVAFRDLWDEPFLASAAEYGRWRDDWLATDGHESHPLRVGAVAEQPGEWLGAIAHGCGAALAPASAARFHARPGVIHRLVSGVGPSRVAGAWAPADDRDPVVQDFVRRCREGVREGGPNTAG